MVHKGNVVNQVPEYVRKYIYERSNCYTFIVSIVREGI